MKPLTLFLAQINPTVGALEANADRILAAARQAADAGAHLVAFPELALSGYPPEDLVLKRHFIEDVAAQLDRIATALPPALVALVGAPVAANGQVYNAAVALRDGAVIATYHKMALPNYGVFDEKRVFAEGDAPCVLEVNGARIGLHVCEDSWSVTFPAVQALTGQRLDLLINLSASPFHRGKHAVRTALIGETARFLGVPVAYVNLVGGQDELVFDGGSFVLDARGEVVAQARTFAEDVLRVDCPWTGHAPAPVVQSLDTAEVYAALRLGLADYVNKNGFAKALIAISGGIDSALVAALAVDALGPDRVVGVTMPSRYSSTGTLGDAHELARRLGIDFQEIPIKALHELYLAELTPRWPGRPPDATEENIQARIRGTLIMALSNKFGWLVLTTGNKSEMATGYCTLYGDMAGGLAVIKDVPKTLVFELCRWRNAQSPGAPPIPDSIITRPPSAELRPDQKDEDSLPPYAVLDPIIERYVERDLGAASIVADGFDPATVARVIRLIDGNEYKRRQGPPGLKITPKSFGRDRRLPITNLYHERVKPPRRPTP
ncbi:MAG TPA: NAD+ synthase [Kiritimatiellia bacterium]|nr:NAD+ synthase [Kiritimatiellia bacterium]HMP33865.1 NAD+ synthase [Kiritimatiellia bacterium]